MLAEPVSHGRLDEIVADERALGHHPAHLGTELRMVLYVPAEDVADVDVLKVEVCGEQGRLGTLAAALYSHDHILAHASPPEVA